MVNLYRLLLCPLVALATACDADTKPESMDSPSGGEEATLVVPDAHEPSSTPSVPASAGTEAPTSSPDVPVDNGDGDPPGAAAAPCAECDVGQVCVDTACVEQVCDPSGPPTCVDSGTRLVCPPPGTTQAESACAEGEICAEGVCEPRSCTPGETRCDGNVVMVCDQRGAGWMVLDTCNPDLGGMSCANGQCIDLCAIARRNRAYLGCAYSAIDLPNTDNNNLGFAISVANSHDQLTARVTITTQDGSLAQLEVAPRSVESFVDTQRRLQMDGTAVLPNVYRVNSSLPIAVYQFNSFETVRAASTDASLLFPDHALDDQYLALTYSGGDTSSHGQAFVAVYAPNQGTEVWVVNGPDATIAASTGRTNASIPQTGPGGHIPFDRNAPPTGSRPLVLGPYDVLLLEALSNAGDLTGTSISASGPIGVFGGNRATQVPTGRLFRDHLEQQIFPRQALGDHYVIGRSRLRPIIDLDEPHCTEDSQCGDDPPAGQSRRFVCCEVLGNVCMASDRCFQCTGDADCAPPDRGAPQMEEDAGPTEICCAERGNRCLRATHCSPEYAIPDYLRVMADLPNTMVSFDPPLFEESLLVEPGDWIELELHDHVEIRSTEPVMIGQFFAGSGREEGNSEGDPTFILGVPVEQYRTDYVFVCPPTYTRDYVSIIAAPDTMISLDGEPVPLEQEVTGSGGMSVTIVLVEDGDHTIEGNAPFGITVYGFGGPRTYEDRDDDGILDTSEDLDGDGHFDNRAEDQNRNGRLDDGEDLDGDGHLDPDEDLDGDGHFDQINEDTNGNLMLDDGEDLDGDNHLDIGEDDNRNGILEDLEVSNVSYGYPGGLNLLTINPKD